MLQEVRSHEDPADLRQPGEPLAFGLTTPEAPEEGTEISDGAGEERLVAG